VTRGRRADGRSSARRHRTEGLPRRPRARPARPGRLGKPQESAIWALASERTDAVRRNREQGGSGSGRRRKLEMFRRSRTCMSGPGGRSGRNALCRDSTAECSWRSRRRKSGRCTTSRGPEVVGLAVEGREPFLRPPRAPRSGPRRPGGRACRPAHADGRPGAASGVEEETPRIGSPSRPALRAAPTPRREAEGAARSSSFRTGCRAGLEFPDEAVYSLRTDRDGGLS